jgi:hypothetical protein
MELDPHAYRPFVVGPDANGNTIEVILSHLFIAG